jgi:hypothetical protein
MYGNGTIIDNELLVCSKCNERCDLWGQCDCGVE